MDFSTNQLSDFILKYTDLTPEDRFVYDEPLMDTATDDFIKKIGKVKPSKTVQMIKPHNACKECKRFLLLANKRKFKTKSKNFPLSRYGFSEQIITRFNKGVNHFLVECKVERLNVQDFKKLKLMYFSYDKDSKKVKLLISEKEIKKFEASFIKDLIEQNSKHLKANAKTKIYKYLKSLNNDSDIDEIMHRLPFKVKKVTNTSDLLNIMMNLGSLKNDYSATSVCGCDHVKNYILYLNDVPFWKKYTRIENIYWTKRHITFANLLGVNNHIIYTNCGKVNYPKVLGRLKLTNSQKIRRKENQKVVKLVVQKTVEVLKKMNFL